MNDKSTRAIYGIGPSLLHYDYAAIEIRMQEHLENWLLGEERRMRGFESGDYIRTKIGPRDLRVCCGGERIRQTPNGHRTQIRVRRVGDHKAHWSWADRWVKASSLEALAAQAADKLG